MRRDNPGPPADASGATGPPAQERGAAGRRPRRGARNVPLRAVET